jgi:hypothetical protein
MLLRTLPRSAAGSAITFRLAGIFVPALIVAAYIIYHPRAYTIVVCRPCGQLLSFLQAAVSRHAAAKAGKISFFIHK